MYKLDVMGLLYYLSFTQSDKETIFKKLLSKGRILPDPAADVIYSNPTHPIKSVFAEKEDETEGRHKLALRDNWTHIFKGILLVPKVLPL